MATRLATLGGGCFWCLEAVFEQLQGVSSVVSGYAGGAVENPSYRAVCSGRTGHAEVVQVTYDPGIVSYQTLLEVFFGTHDPTTLNRQGADVGTQYRSIILWHDAEQQTAAEAMVAELEAEGVFDDPIVTERRAMDRFWIAEEHHQGYFRANPTQGYCAAVVGPKVAKFRRRYAHLLQS